MNGAASASAEDVFSGTKPVEERHRFDEARAEWMSGNVSGYQRPLTVSQWE